LLISSVILLDTKHSVKLHLNSVQDETGLDITVLSQVLKHDT